MTGPKPPIDALDEQERELARVLRALPGGEPPAALDQKILRAAANAAASSRRPRARWLASVGSLWGIGGAAAAVLALGITWQMIDPSRPDSGQRSRPVPAESPSADSTVSVDLGEPSAASELQAPASPAPVAIEPAAPARKSLAPATRANTMSASPPPPPALAGAAEASVRDAPAAAPAASGVSPIDAASVESTSIMSAEPISKYSQAEQAAQAQAEKASGVVARAEAAQAQDSQAAAKAMTPAAWLAKVRKLKAEKRLGEARDSLQLFHQYYPQYVIPADLAPLLRE